MFGEYIEQRLLVYDLETYATGFADPNWVPQVPTCVAWKFLGEEEVFSTASIDYAKAKSMPHLQPKAIEKMLNPFLAALAEADGVVVYNGMRFDNPVLNGAMWYIRRPPLEPILTYDLIQFGKIKGVKKGLDNVAEHLDAVEKKLSLNHSEWTTAYLETGWTGIKERAKSDVRMTEEVYFLKKELGWLRSPKKWTP